MRVIVAADGPPGGPRDPQDHPDDPEANQRIGEGHSDRAGRGDGAKVGWRLGVNQTRDRLDPGYAGGDEDRKDNEQTGVACGTF